TEQIKSGEPYNVFKKCVSISILDFILFPDETEFYSCFHIREDKRQFLYTDKMEFHLIELPKLPQELKDDKDDILLWAKFISSERKEDFEMLATKNTYIQSAYKTLQVISQDDQKRMEYEARQKALRDYNQGMLEAEKRGREEGIKEGEQRGREEGRKEEKENTAKKMIAIGLPTDIIAQTTGLSNAQIESLR
ncbi:MAG: Rpn family recombination-promoting nuclease/putative transposase, partial [Lachnospiraceae bacterium]|nr:Rpn family recombination-promoting nuclease/putative transposase [Lachnospiraceae bacterium]